MADRELFIQIFGDPAISDVSDSGKWSMSSRLDQSNSTLSMSVGSIPGNESGYSSERVLDDFDDQMDDHPEAEDPNDDIPLDQLPEVQPDFADQHERFDFWNNRGAFDGPEEPIVIEQAPEDEPALIHVDDPHFGLQNPIVQALVLAGLGNIVPAEHIVLRAAELDASPSLAAKRRLSSSSGW